MLNGISIPGRHLIILSVPLRHGVGRGGEGRGWLADIWIGETSQARNRTGWSSLKPAAPFSSVHSVWNRELVPACTQP